MCSKNITVLLMTLVMSSFSFNSFAAWAVKKGSTTCVGNTCHHSTVKKGCVNGNCGTVRHSTTWHR